MEAIITINDVEYTRTDAFIEKVSDWLKDCATFTDTNGKKHIDKEMYKTTFDDFVNYVKEKQDMTQLEIYKRQLEIAKQLLENALCNLCKSR